jgi:hypothetical protein
LSNGDLALFAAGGGGDGLQERQDNDKQPIQSVMSSGSA